jgi:hypothetical protein
MDERRRRPPLVDLLGAAAGAAATAFFDGLDRDDDASDGKAQRAPCRRGKARQRR